MSMRGRRRSRSLGLRCALTVGLATLAAQDAPPQSTPPEAAPKKIDLVETTERRLVQIDVTALGPAAAIASLTAADFQLVVNGQWIEAFTVDRLCGEPAAGLRVAAGQAEPERAAPALAAARPTTSYLIYFDQHHLTLAGRQNAIDDAREMIPTLLADGSRIAIASSGEVVDLLIPFTSDSPALLQTLDRLENDRRYWDQYPQLEESRIRELLEVQNTLGQDGACSKARFLQQQDLYNTDKALRRFAMMLGLLTDLDPPKVALYFGDTVRRDAGSHYYSYVGRCTNSVGQQTPSMFNAEHALDRVIATASANGIRLYTVQAEGLVTGDTLAVPGVSSPLTFDASGRSSGPRAINPNQQRIRQAQDALAGMALETGGQSFLNGIAAPKMVTAIHDDVSCVYLLSFDGAQFKLDTPLSVRVETQRPKVELRTRGRLVLPSESERRTARLLAAFAAPGAVKKDLTIRGTLIPIGFDHGAYRALVQVGAPGSPVPEAVWDLGASLVSGGEIRMDDSGRLTVRQAGVPVVFETEMRFEPGPYELILVAHDTTSNQLGTVRLEGKWPERADGPAISPIAVVQRDAGSVFLRQGAPRVGGSVARADREAVRPADPTALLTLVCRGRGKRKLRVARSLGGETTTEFAPMDIEFDDEPCVQIRDVIPAGTMTDGRFEYRVRVLDGDTELASASQAIYAVGDAAAAAADGS